MQKFGKLFDKDILEILNLSYQKFEKNWWDKVNSQKGKELSKSAFDQFSSLLSIVMDNKIYIANAGNSKPLILREDGKNEYTLEDLYNSS